MLGLVLTVLVAVLGHADVCDAPAPVPAAAHGNNPWVEPARDVLVPACGSCHRPGLPTSNAGALAVFNLHERVWYQTMTDEQLRKLAGRIRGTSTVTEGDRKVIAQFVACEVDGSCDGEEAEEIPE